MKTYKNINEATEAADIKKTNQQTNKALLIASVLLLASFIVCNQLNILY